MKWAVVILVILGLVAALSAALLISGSPLNRRAGLKVSPEDDVVMAAKPLPAASVITSSDVKKCKALRKELPEGYLSSPIQAIGKILDVPIVLPSPPIQSRTSSEFDLQPMEHQESSLWLV